jgi:hypothetical protein
MGEEGIADAHVGGDSAAEITGQQDRAKNRGLRDDVEERTDQQHDPDRDDNLLGISELNASLHRNRRRANKGDLRKQQRSRRRFSERGNAEMH